MVKSEDPTDKELVIGCRKNDRRTQEMLYRRYSRTMYNICLLYEKDRDDAKDILQEAFLKVFRSIDSFDINKSLPGWIRKIVVNTAIDNFRKKGFEKILIEHDDSHVLVPSNEGILENLFADDIISSLGTLPEGARMIFQLYAIEGYSHKEIAEMLNISEGTSKSQTNRARNMLKEYLKHNS